MLSFFVEEDRRRRRKTFQTDCVRSNIIKRLKARRAKGIKWSEDEALADAERMPWCFDNTSSEESSSEDDDDEPAAKRKREK